jgi:hypothetical protein
LLQSAQRREWRMHGNGRRGCEPGRRLHIGSSFPKPTSTQFNFLTFKCANLALAWRRAVVCRSGADTDTARTALRLKSAEDIAQSNQNGEKASVPLADVPRLFNQATGGRLQCITFTHPSVV